MSRTIFIGDVHGCIVELIELVTRLQAAEGDRFVFVGDLVDKGPESLQVLRYVRQLLDQFPESVVVSGNHEEKASRLAKRGECAEPWCMDATPSDWAFVDTMPLTWYDPQLDLRVVHGGIFPALLVKHPDAFEKIEARGSEWRKGGGKVMNRARRMLRVRYVNSNGDMLALGENQEGDPFWAETYDGSEGTVIFGHSPWIDGEPRVYGASRGRPHAVGIDTACVFGGRLTAYVVGDQSQFVSVKAAERYAEFREEGDS